MSLDVVGRGLGPAFPEPVLDSQRTFRAVLEAMSHPGMVVSLPPFGSPPPGLAAAAVATVLTLVDFDTPLWLDPAASSAADFFRFHCNCRVAEAPEDASFALIADPSQMPRLSAFRAGSDEFPDRSATLVLQVDAFAEQGRRFRGPGIRNAIAFSARPLPADFDQQWRDNMALYPRGVDLIMASDRAVAALPRSSQMES